MQNTDHIREITKNKILTINNTFSYYSKKEEFIMLCKENLTYLIGNPVGIAFNNGTGTSGVLRDIKDNILYLIEYLYQKQFATKHYDLNTIKYVNPFPALPQDK